MADEFTDEFSQDELKLLDELESSFGNESITSLSLDPATAHPISTVIPRKASNNPSTSCEIPKQIFRQSIGSSALQKSFFENWDSEELSTIEKKFKGTKRRFPGPAGLLPVIKQNDIQNLNIPSHPLTRQVQKIISSDLKAKELSKEGLSPESPERAILEIPKTPWRKLMRILKLNSKDPSSILNKVNLKWVQSIIAKSAAPVRIPFLALVIKKTNKSSKRLNLNECVHAMDSSGSMFVSFDADIRAKYTQHLKTGTAIAIKDVPILRLRKENIIMVTEANLIAIVALLPADTDNEDKKAKICNPLERCVVEDDVTILHFNEFNQAEVNQRFTDINNLT